MPRRFYMLVSLAICLSFSCISMSASAENWPAWRGPRGDGTSRETNVPIRWDAAKGINVDWKVEIPGEGHASPIVWNDRVFIVSCVKETNERLLICLDRESGKTIWRRAVIKSPLETKHLLNSCASGTPATDGELIYVTFLEVGDRTIPAPNVSTPRPITPGEMVVAAYDFDGNRKWLVKPGEFISAHGYCSCPVIYEDLVIINGDHDGDSYIVALNKKTGEKVWKVAREHKTRSYVTPIIRDYDGRTQLILSGSKCVTSYDPRDGSLHWQIDGPTEQFVASMVDNGKLLFLTAGFPDKHVLAIRPDGRGNVTDSHIVWRTTKNCSYVPSPIVEGDYFLVAADNGVVTCYEAATGETQWIERLGVHYSGSLVAAGGLVYFPADDGVVKVVRPGPKFDLVAENNLGEHTYASPAISHGQFFIRGEKHLFCFGREQAAGK